MISSLSDRGEGVGMTDSVQGHKSCSALVAPTHL